MTEQIEVLVQGCAPEVEDGAMVLSYDATGEDFVLPADGESVWVPTGLVIDVPDGHVAAVVGEWGSHAPGDRSFMSLTDFLEEGFEGELLVRIVATARQGDPIVIVPGQRLATLRVLEAETSFRETDVMPAEFATMRRLDLSGRRRVAGISEATAAPKEDQE